MKRLLAKFVVVFVVSISASSVVMFSGCSDTGNKKNAKNEGPKRQSTPKKMDPRGLHQKLVDDDIVKLRTASVKERLDICDTLMNMSYNAQGALPTLKKMKEKDKSAKVRKAAKRAYDHIYDKTYPIIEPEKKKKK